MTLVFFRLKVSPNAVYVLQKRSIITYMSSSVRTTRSVLSTHTYTKQGSEIVERKVRCWSAVPSISYVALKLQEEMDFETRERERDRDREREIPDAQVPSITFFSCSPLHHDRPTVSKNGDHKIFI